MRLLLDEMFPATIAGRLRVEHGHDVSGASERDDLRGLADTDLFAASQSEERAIVTENVRDSDLSHENGRRWEESTSGWCSPPIESFRAQTLERWGAW